RNSVGDLWDRRRFAGAGAEDAGLSSDPARSALADLAGEVRRGAGRDNSGLLVGGGALGFFDFRRRSVSRADRTRSTDIAGRSAGVWLALPAVGDGIQPAVDRRTGLCVRVGDVGPDAFRRLP